MSASAFCFVLALVVECGGELGQCNEWCGWRWSRECIELLGDSSESH